MFGKIDAVIIAHVTALGRQAQTGSRPHHPAQPCRAAAAQMPRSPCCTNILCSYDTISLAALPGRHTVRTRGQDFVLDLRAQELR
jgi:hypothetical protein